MIPGSKTKEEEENLLALKCSRLLEAEIEFWREVIATAPANQSEQSLERMHQALALAETKWAQLADRPDPKIPDFEHDYPRWCH